jgi:Uma2 family endonuclease
MNPPAAPYTWNYSEYARFPDDGNRYEVIDGEVLVTPAPSPQHQNVLGRLFVAMHECVVKHGLGVVLLDVDVLFATGHFLRPDLVFVTADHRDGISDRGIEVPPRLIVEIQSPTSGSIDRMKKPRRYGDFGVPEYWVLDPVAREVLVWRFATGAREPEIHLDVFEWRPHGQHEPLVLDPVSLFAPL